MNTSILKDGSATTDTGQLAVLARKAHEQNRTKECLGLINQILVSEPDNSEALTLRAAVFADMEQDLSDARVLLTDSQSREDGHKYRKAAEIILLKILYLDPSHAEAKALLATARASSEPQQPAPLAVDVPKPAHTILNDLQFTAQPAPVETKPERTGGSGLARKVPILLAGFVLLTAGGLFLYRPHSTNLGATTEAAAETATGAKGRPAKASPAPLSTANDLSSPSAPAPAEPKVTLAAATPAVTPVVAAAPGSLAVTSPTSTEIYLDGKYLGETPTTLQLPAGRQTLEYRHGDLRATMTHDIRSRETTTALVTYEVTVQINARPWAQVFVDGTVRKPLGQTPLSSVRVPLGSVLAFENPNFPPKSYRITEKDSSIQVVFP